MDTSITMSVPLYLMSKILTEGSFLLFTFVISCGSQSILAQMSNGCMFLEQSSHFKPILGPLGNLEPSGDHI